MIKAEFFKKNNNYVGFKVSGHAGYGVSGYDIACASVSSAVQITINTITDSFNILSNVNVESNSITLKSKDESSEIFHKMVYGFYLHMELLSQEFKKNIKIVTTEV